MRYVRWSILIALAVLACYWWFPVWETLNCGPRCSSLWLFAWAGIGFWFFVVNASLKRLFNG